MVTPTEKARRSEALYYDNHNITRRTLCDRIVNLEADMEEVKAENARLRKELESVGTAAYLYGRSDLKAENAKLRELVRDMYRCSDPCNDCPHYNGSSSDFYCRLGIGWKARRMRELGVEAS